MICLLASFCIALAYFVEHILGYKPCILCLYERLPYFALIIFACFGIIKSRCSRAVMILLKLTFLGAGILSFYHVGIEYNFFDPTSICEVQKGFGRGLTVTQMLDQLNASSLSDCRKPEFKLLGLSMAEINLGLNILMFFFTIVVCKFRKAK